MFKKKKNNNKKGKNDNEPAAFQTDEERLARLVSAAERLPFAVCAGSIGRHSSPAALSCTSHPRPIAHPLTRRQHPSKR
jgi:hypothetical protein